MSTEPTETRSAVSDAADESRPSVGELVRKLESLLSERDLLKSERDHYKQLADFLKKELDRLNDLQKTPREHVDPNQVQLAFEKFAKELLEKLNAGKDSESGAAPFRRRESA